MPTDDLASLPLPAAPLGLFTDHADVGPVKHKGSVAYDAATDTYTLTAAGTNMWGPTDEFGFLFRKITGDFRLDCRLRFPQAGVDAHRKAGLIIRAGLAPDAPYADAAAHGDGLTSLQYRPTAGANTLESASPVKGPTVLQLSRAGTRISMSVAHDGATYEDTQTIDLDLGAEAQVGLFLTSHNADVVETAVFENVRITVPAGPKLVSYREFLESNLEILDVAAGRRRIIHRTADSMQAPNWTPDDKTLIFNRNGRLYAFDLATAAVRAIDTGFATRNNNDHVLSFDGKYLAISHHADEAGGKSRVYVVPTTGGTPRLVTPTGPSYLHGWSPDGQTLVFTGERGDGNYDVYAVPSAGGTERRLTTAPGLDDGPEYSPDGQYIYFNSVRSGLMQLWRMRPDGSDQTQLTDDQFNNWFPHVSPDGRQIAFLSFGQDVKPSDHPFYKHVYIRTMPVDGGTPRVVAYLYGGQGTINVPSWAPDSKRLAFVTNTGAF